MMEIGISSYTYNWWTGVPGYPMLARPLTPGGLLECAAELDVRVVQIADNMPLHLLAGRELELLRSQAAHLGIAIETGTSGIRPEHLRRYLEISRQLGAKFLRTLIDASDDRPDANDAVAMLREIAPEFERAGVTLGIENHDRFSARTLLSVIERTRSDAVGICLDTANSLGCGEGIEYVAEILRRHVVNLHVKDFTVRRLPHKKGYVVEGTAAGQGLLGIPSLLRMLQRPDRDLSVIVELWTSPEESIQKSVVVEDRRARESVAYLRSCILSQQTG